MVPVVSPYPMLIQVFRSDFSRQISSTHVTTWNLGTSRGLNLIPVARTEVDILVPPFLVHSDKTPDGFGDVSFTGKYRILSANEKKGNYLLSASLTTAITTGSYKNGATNATITPVITGGKGLGKFDAIIAIGGALPTGNTATIGRTLTSNVVFQYHVQKYIWPELEINTTAWYGGSKDGKVQTLLTPGLMLGKYSPWAKGDPTTRLGFAAGAGLQTSVTTYRTYNHNLVFTGRILF
jgi:opacity protein-like surface antigen